MLDINIGKPSPLGSTITSKGVNFSLIAPNAKYIEILIFDSNNSLFPSSVYKLDTKFQSGPYWHAEIEGLKEGSIYAYRVYQLDNGINNDYSSKVLIDPCSRGITGWENYNRNEAMSENDNVNTCLKSVVCDRDKFNFKDFPRPKRSWQDSIIYELHIGSFTKESNLSKDISNESCFEKSIKKISYFKELGITAIELLPIFCFDPTDGPKGLENYWGYSPISWFTPHFKYFKESSSKEIRTEFKRFVEECHKNDIEVILDVVFNHTSEGNSEGPILSWKGVDENLYYFIDDKKQYQDVSGCGNTISANKGLVRKLILESIKCWANEFGIDGFRFDLGIALTRGENLVPLKNPPLFEDIESDPELTDIKLISEPWDCGGLYKLGDFPSKSTFTWNGHFRDDVRRFWKGDENTAWNIKDKIVGSPELYEKYSSCTKSINFITSHDGFTLKDLVSFNVKHNFANREQNKDGENNNNSWNHGIEGPSTNIEINQLRNRQQRNLLFTLLFSKGVPMILMGDEIGRSQGGNNNVWCQNNPLGFMNWENEYQDQELLAFTKSLIKLRRKYIDFIYPINISNELYEYHWHGIDTEKPDWSSWSHTVAFSINKNKKIPLFWFGLNAYTKDIKFNLPKTKSKWVKILDTYETKLEQPQINADKYIYLKNRSSVLLVAKEVLEPNDFI